MTVLELPVPQGGYPAGLQDCPTCGERLRLLRRYLRINPTEKGDLLVEFADPAAGGYNGKRAKQFTLPRKRLEEEATQLLVPREQLEKVGLKLCSQEGLSPLDRDLIVRLALQEIKDIQVRWRWLRDSTTVWYEHASPPKDHAQCVRVSTIPSTFQKWASPLFAVLYVCGYSYSEIAKQVGIDTKSGGRSTVATAIKSLLARNKISRESVSEAHKRNQGRSTCRIQKRPDRWVLVIESVDDTDHAWLRVLGHDLGFAVGNQGRRDLDVAERHAVSMLHVS